MMVKNYSINNNKNNSSRKGKRAGSVLIGVFVRLGLGHDLVLSQPDLFLRNNSNFLIFWLTENDNSIRAFENYCEVSTDVSCYLITSTAAIRLAKREAGGRHTGGREGGWGRAPSLLDEQINN